MKRQIPCRLRSKIGTEIAIFFLKEVLDFDKDDPYNCGVDSYTKVVFKSGATFRKITYTDPETHKQYTYLTTVEDVSPGLLAFLYYWRWKIEKVFDVFKNKLHETKSWANGKYAMDIQSPMIAMAYNFLLYTKDIALGEFDIKEHKLDIKRKKGLEKRI